MKTLNVKLPVSVLSKYKTDNSQLINNIFRHYLEQHLSIDESGRVLKYQYDPELDVGLTTNYAFKINDDLHKDLKLACIQQNVNMNEYAGQVIYHEFNKRNEL